MSNRHHEDEVMGGAHCTRGEGSSGEMRLEIRPEPDLEGAAATIVDYAYGRGPATAELDELRAPLPADSAERKEYPIFSGLFKYFPHALAAVARVSYIGNQKHNPGQPLHWSRDKSSDHLDCIARHLLEAGGIDFANGGVRHSAQLAWRALANLQIEIEKAKGIKQ